MPDILADKSDASDHRNEPVSMMEPLCIAENSKYRQELLDLVMELAAKSAAFKHSLPAALEASLKDIVRSMNCYYSNLIEGHDTHPIAIEQALKGDYSSNPQKRNLQQEAKAHIEVQKWIDQSGIKTNFFSETTLSEIHRRFCSLLPEDLLWVNDQDSTKKIRLIPGELRKIDVRVGNHIAISPKAIPRFLARFESVYNALGKTETILELAASHHRLLWIHPFLDGNGRVARLMSHAVILNLLDTGSIWSISRGLARNATAYKSHLANCDLPKRNDLDGRGNLSEEALVDFTRFFLITCIDQVEFMEKLMQPRELKSRILIWVQEEILSKNLPPQSKIILEAILYRGEISRSELPSIIMVSDRHARRLTKILIDKGILVADTKQSALRLAFPATLASRWMPGLFP